MKNKGASGLPNYKVKIKNVKNNNIYIDFYLLLLFMKMFIDWGVNIKNSIENKLKKMQEICMWWFLSNRLLRIFVFRKSEKDFKAIAII